jgi:cell division septum initiation protein DivIVA
MARSNILDRFRPAGAPGPAGPVGVPATGEQGPAVELAPVFAALSADVESCRRTVDEARRDADRALSSAREQAVAIIARARLDEGAERARAAARVEQAASAQDARLLARARKDADDLERSRTALLPGMVRAVMDRLLSEQLTSGQQAPRP